MENIEGPLDIGEQMTVNLAINKLNDMLEMIKVTALIGSGVQERLFASLQSLRDMVNDFTDFPFTEQNQREQILEYLNECSYEMNNLDYLKVNFSKKWKIII